MLIYTGQGIGYQAPMGREGIQPLTRKAFTNHLQVLRIEQRLLCRSGRYWHWGMGGVGRMMDRRP